MWNCSWNTPFMHYGGIFGTLVTALVVVTLVYIVILIVRPLFARKTSAGGGRDSQDIIRNKFARGKISEEEYIRMKNILDP